MLAIKQEGSNIVWHLRSQSFQCWQRGPHRRILGLLQGLLNTRDTGCRIRAVAKSAVCFW